MGLVSVPLPNGIDAEKIYRVLKEGTDIHAIVWCTYTDSEQKCVVYVKSKDMRMEQVIKDPQHVMFPQLLASVFDMTREIVVKLENLTDVIAYSI